MNWLLTPFIEAAELTLARIFTRNIPRHIVGIFTSWRWNDFALGYVIATAGKKDQGKEREEVFHHEKKYL